VFNFYAILRYIRARRDFLMFNDKVWNKQKQDKWWAERRLRPVGDQDRNRCLCKDAQDGVNKVKEMLAGK
jgi:hypothetical protein